MISESIFQGEPAVILSSKTLQAVFLPAHGGKLVSLKNLENGFEYLFQNPRNSFGKAQRGSSFDAGEACGFDDAFPNIGPEKIELFGKFFDYPDHGEIWSAEFSKEIEGETLTENWISPMGYQYQKCFSLAGNVLTGKWKIRNIGSAVFPCFWTMHFLAAYQETMRIHFPPETTEILNVMDSDCLGKAESRYAFPLGQAPGGLYDFCAVPPRKSHRMEKYYVKGIIHKGMIGYEYPDAHTGLKIEYDPQKLPYLGFWVTAGGWRGDYNCALEPSNGFYDRISCAAGNSCLPVLQPDEEMAFEIRMSALSSGSFED